MPHLTLPNAKYQTSFIQAVTEYQAEGLGNYLQLDVADLRRDFAAYLQQLENERSGRRLPPGYIPHTVYWLVEGDEYLGRLDIRHELTDQLEKNGGQIGYDIRPTKRRQGLGTLILKLGLAKAAELGYGEILITCDVQNLSSNAIIRKNGGQLLDTQPATDGQAPKNRYTIALH